jgi:hypothetical protein
LAAHATLYDFRDIDLMMRIADESERRIESTELAEAVGLGENGGARALGRRLAWMKRYGFVTYNEKEHYWALSAAGERITAAHLKAAQTKSLEKVPDEAMVEVMSHVTSRYRHGDPIIANLLRREFLFGTQKR